MICIRSEQRRGPASSQVLDRNTTLSTLRLRSNALDADALRALAGALEFNTGLLTLDQPLDPTTAKWA